jgi:hypothetical protein
VRADFMSSTDDPAEPDGAVQARFAALFQTFFDTGQTTGGGAEAAVIADRLQARRGARLICCDRSIVTYGWGLTAEGCSLSLFSDLSNKDTFDGAIWSLDELGDPPDREILQTLANVLSAGARLVIDAGDLKLIKGWAHFPTIPALSPLGVSRTPAGRRLYTFVHEL